MFFFDRRVVNAHKTNKVEPGVRKLDIVLNALIINHYFTPSVRSHRSFDIASFVVSFVYLLFEMRETPVSSVRGAKLSVLVVS